MNIIGEKAVYTPSDVHPLHQVLDALRDSPLAPYIRIFGSAAKTPWDKLPGDIDAFVDLNEVKLEPELRKQATADLLRLAEKHYGSFDPFVSVTKRIGTHPTGKPVFQQVLWTRDVYARQWVVAKHKGKLTAAGRAGTPLSSLNV